MMMITFNNEWETPNDQSTLIEANEANNIAAKTLASHTIAPFGTNYRVQVSDNDNLPSWLTLYEC